MHESVPQFNEPKPDDTGQFELDFDRIEELGEARPKPDFKKREVEPGEIDDLQKRFKEEGLEGEEFGAFILRDIMERLDKKNQKGRRLGGNY